MIGFFVGMVYFLVFFVGEEVRLMRVPEGILPSLFMGRVLTELIFIARVFGGDG